MLNPQLRLVIASLKVSDYTGKVDVPRLMTGAKRTHCQVKEMCSMFTGLCAGIKLAAGRDLLENRNFEKYSEHIEAMLEFSRRHKIMNPGEHRRSAAMSWSPRRRLDLTARPTTC